MNSFGATPFGTDILKYMQIGRWAFELDEGKEPRMYCDDTLCELLGIKNDLTPEENYRAWYASIDPEYVPAVEKTVSELIGSEFASIVYPAYHPTKGRIYVRCSGVRNLDYKNGVRLEGLHREITNDVLKESKNQQALKEDLQAIQGLASEYNVLHFLDIRTDEYTSYFFDPNSPEEAVRMNNESKNYYEAHKESIPVFCHPEYLETIMKYGDKEYLISALRHKKKIVERFLCMDRNGSYKWTDFVLLKFDGIDEEPTRVAVGYVDVDAEQNEKMAQAKAVKDAMYAAQKALKERDEQLKNLKALAGLYFSMHLIDLENDTFEEIKADPSIRPFFAPDRKASEVMNEIMEKMIVPEYKDSARAFMDVKTLANRMKGLKNYSGELLGNLTGWFIANFVAVDTDEEGRPIKVLCTIQTINAQKKREETLFIRSMTDELTKLFNRTAYEDELESYRGQEIPADLLFIALDLNRLKYTNDTLGHAAGDEIICGLADCMRESYGQSGKLFRIGGDEFIAIIRASEEQFSVLEERFNSLVMQWTGKLVNKLNVSSGRVTGHEAEGETIDYIAKLADKRMYEAKERFYRENGFDRRKH